MNILISGKQRSGKDFIAKIFEEESELTRRGLADSMKDIYSNLTGLSTSHIEKLKNINGVRQQLIILGQSRKTFIDPDFWLKQIPEGSIISDIRYVDEINYFPKESRTLVRVECPIEIRKARGVITNQEHSSESQLDNYYDWDYVMDGSKSYDELKTDVKNILRSIASP